MVERKYFYYKNISVIDHLNETLVPKVRRSFETLVPKVRLSEF
jgi:hypothetical protein